METVRDVPLGDALTDLRDADSVFVRLALSRGDTGPTELRSLVIDVLPSPWLVSHDQYLLAPWLKDQRVFECSRALFFCGLLKGETVRGWFAHPDDCGLTDFDSRPGYASRRVRFSLPELHDTAVKWPLASFAQNVAKAIPYPSALYRLNPKPLPTFQHRDDDPLVSEDGDYFPSFRIARAELIFGVTDRNQAYQRDDVLAIRVVDARGWLKELRVMPGKVAVIVAGLDVFGKSFVVLEGGGFRDSQPVSSPHATLNLPAKLPDVVAVHLVCDGGVLDEAEFTSATSLFPHKSPQVIVERPDVHTYAAPARTEPPAHAPEAVLVAEGGGEPHPKVFISYSHDSREHTDKVQKFATRLRSEGVDCLLDRYDPHPSRGWPDWMLEQITSSDFVLVVCTETYCRRFDGKEAAGKGLGAAWEGGIIKQTLYDQAGENDKFIPVIFSPEDVNHIPEPLRRATRYLVSDEEDYDALYGRLTNQVIDELPPLGSIRPVKRVSAAAKGDGEKEA